MIGDAEIKEMEEALKEFQEKFEMEPDGKLWENLCEEEYIELLKEIADYMYVTVGQNVAKGRPVQGDVFIKTDLDMLSAFTGSGILMEAFRRIHQSNMSKLGDDGKPIRREDGKILKGPNYKPPYLKDLI